MKRPYLLVCLLFFLNFMTACGHKEGYIHREDALKRGYIVMEGTNSHNHERFDMFLKNVDSKREDQITIVIYDLVRNQYVLTIDYDGENYYASRYFMDQNHKKSQTIDKLLFTHLSYTSSKNYFLTNENKIHSDLWIYQGK